VANPFGEGKAPAKTAARIIGSSDLTFGRFKKARRESKRRKRGPCEHWDDRSGKSNLRGGDIRPVPFYANPAE
jgi:hypothetical protein